MIPLRLRLENFMSYATLDLDFEGMHLAVLTGANGAGKSSLLDAITYALWEKARATPEALIRLGQPEMWVELTFEVEGRRYRVFRRRTRKTGVGSQLELQAEQDGAWVPLTGVTTRETQARIVSVVKMDFDTFLNSAYLRQGRADEFTTRTPQERKAVLAEILGLDTYDALAARARDHGREAQQTADRLDAERAGLEAALEARPGLDAELVSQRAELATVATALEAAERDRARLVEEGRALDAARVRREAAGAERTAAEEDRSRIGSEIVEATRAAAEAASALADQAAIEAAYDAWREAGEHEHALRLDAEAHQALERDRAEAERRLQDASHHAELALQAIDAELAALAREAEGHQAVLKDRARIESAQATLAAAREGETIHLEKARRAQALENGAIALRTEARRAELMAEVAVRELTERLERARATADERETLLAEIERHETRLRAFDVKMVEADRLKEKGFAHRARVEELKRAIEQAQAAGLAKAARLEAVRRPENAMAGPSRPAAPEAEDCPACERALDAEAREAVARRLQAEVDGCDDEAVRLDHLLAEAEERLAESRARYQAIAKRLKGRDELLKAIGALEARLTDAEAAHEEAERLDTQIAAVRPEVPAETASALAAVEHELAEIAYDPAELSVLQARISDHRWADARGWQLEQSLAALKRLDERRDPLIARRASLEAAWHDEQDAHQAQMKDIAERLAALDGAPKAHAEALGRLDALAAAPAAWAAMQQGLVGLATARGRLARLEAERTAAVARLAALGQEDIELTALLARASAWGEEAAANEAALMAMRDRERRGHAALGRLEAESRRLDEAARRLEAVRGELAEAAADASAYRELAAAFGKNGIQAIVIENAVPELEEEANRLLGRLTEGRMHVRLATQREKKSGGAAETLEIHIADEVGTRPYELYSGGEAFRVNFALRLALSRLLARRAGAKLQTLIIDEGFGTQDERGREKLVEAIGAVSAEFQRILVITHIRELKDAFNTHIEVTKRHGVSEVRAVA